VDDHFLPGSPIDPPSILFIGLWDELEFWTSSGGFLFRARVANIFPPTSPSYLLRTFQPPPMYTLSSPASFWRLDVAPLLFDLCGISSVSFPSVPPPRPSSPQWRDTGKFRFSLLKFVTYKPPPSSGLFPFSEVGSTLVSRSNKSVFLEFLWSWKMSFPLVSSVSFRISSPGMNITVCLLTLVFLYYTPRF